MRGAVDPLPGNGKLILRYSFGISNHTLGQNMRSLIEMDFISFRHAEENITGSAYVKEV
jgi:hypothetical protein